MILSMIINETTTKAKINLISGGDDDIDDHNKDDNDEITMMMMTAWDNWRAQAPISQWGLGAHKTPPVHRPPSI